MKKKIHFISLFLILVMIVSAVAVSASKSFDPDDLVMITSDIVNIKAEARLELSVDFYIPTEDIDYLEEHANNLRVYAIVVDYTDKVVDPKDDLGLSMDLKKGDVRTVNGVSCYTYNFDLGVILPEDYNSSYAVRGFISYELSGRSYKTASDFTKANNVITPYEDVYSVYCDRSDTKTESHPYEAPDGTYTPVSDLNALRKILSANLRLEIENGKVKDLMENEYYKSLYDIEYIDYEGILILSLEGGEDMPKWLLEELYINGEKRYFEIHNGIIKLVV